MTAEEFAELVAVLRAVAQPSGPDFMTLPELAVYLRLDDEGVKDPVRWLRERLQPSHPEYLPHHRFTRNRPVFSREDRAEIRTRYRKATPEAAGQVQPSVSMQADARILEFERTAKRGARALGLGGDRTTA